MPLRDRYKRTFGKLRISLTPACNFRCTYCRPATGVPVPPPSELLSFDEIVRVAGVAVELGMTKLRLTGGEPLVRPEVPQLVQRLSAEAGATSVGMTSNGSLLRRHAAALNSAGLSSVNVSLDTLDRHRASQLARADVLPDVLDGIEAAIDAGLPVKLNAVVMPGVNDAPDDLADLCGYAAARRVPLRFIEYMPMGQTGDALHGTASTVTAAETRRRLSAAGVVLHAGTRHDAADPAAPWFDDAGNEIGFIHSISGHFCDACDRMRLTAVGGLRPCLHQDAEVDLRRTLRGGGTAADIRNVFAEAASLKWAGHQMNALVPLTVRREMVTIGG